MGENSQVYSYHTFIYPFLWDRGGTLSMEEFEDRLKLKDSGAWQPDEVLKQDWKLSGKDSPDEERWNYQRFQYFNNAARKALFQSGGGIVSRYVFMPGQIHNQGKYVIRTTGKEYKLDINNIRLMIFNTGVAMMIYEMEYRPDAKMAVQAKRNAVMEINEFGRRVYPEFLPKAEDGFILCAESIGIQSRALGIEIKDDFRDWVGTTAPYQNPVRLPNIVKNILGYKLNTDADTDIFTDDRAKEGSLYLEPAIDDRMFVCCCITEGAYAKYFMASAGPDDPRCYETDWNVAKELYALINIDPSAEDCSCQDRREIDRYLREQLYLRWADYGTFHAVTNHSFLCLTDGDAVMAEVVVPFLLLYVELSVLVLAQRATLISLDAKITDAAGADDMDHWEQLIRLERTFARFQGELMLQEVTSQIQGIELYAKLQKMLFVDRLEANIQRQLNNLYEIAEARQAERLQKREKEEAEAKRKEEKARLEQAEKEAKAKEAEQKAQDAKQHRIESLFMGLGILTIFSAITDLVAILIGVFGGEEQSKNMPMYVVGGLIVLAIVALVCAIAFRKPRDRKGSESK